MNTPQKPQLHKHSVSNCFFDIDELRNIAVNYAITCQNGYEGTFDEWFEKLSLKFKCTKCNDTKKYKNVFGEINVCECVLNNC